MWQLIGLVIFHYSIVAKGAVRPVPSPSASVTCGRNGEDTRIYIAGVTDIRQWSPQEWRLNSVDDPRCEPTFDINNQSIHYTINISYCSPLVTEELDTLNYTLFINASKNGTTPVLAYDHLYEIVCAYTRNGTAQAHFIPLHDLSDNASGREDLTFVLKLYADDSHKTPLAQNIPLGTPIYAQVSLDHQFPQPLDVSLVHIFLSKDQDGLLLPYSLISDSCVLESQANNQTRVTYDCENQLNSTNKDFSFVAVRYPGQDNGDSVWVHCVIYTCVVGDTSSVCVDQCANCTNRRRRRDVDTLPSDNTYELIAGPYTFVEDENGKEDLPDAVNKEQNADEPAISGNVMIALAVSGVVAIAIVCVTVVIVLRKRGEKFPGNETVASGMAMENLACEARA